MFDYISKMPPKSCLILIDSKQSEVGGVLYLYETFTSTKLIEEDIDILYIYTNIRCVLNTIHIHHADTSSIAFYHLLNIEFLNRAQHCEFCFKAGRSYVRKNRWAK